MDLRQQYLWPHSGWGKILATSFSLKRHVDLKHRRQKNQVCKFWGKRFSLLQYLKEHILIHTQETPFVCGINDCKEAFRQRAKLWAHRKTHNRDQNQKDFVNDSLNFKNSHEYSAIFNESEIQNEVKRFENIYCLWGINEETHLASPTPKRLPKITLPSLNKVQGLLTDSFPNWL